MPNLEIQTKRRVQQDQRKFSSVSLLVGLTLLSGNMLSAQAARAATGFESRSVDVHRSTRTIHVDLNPKTVLCSKADYSMPMLKVLIPELAGITLLDHQNTGAGAPCVTTGQVCDFDGVGPEAILQGRSGRESIQVEVIAERFESIDHQTQKCEVMLKETVNTVIRGQTLTHERWADLGQRNYQDCIQGINAAANRQSTRGVL